MDFKRINYRYKPIKTTKPLDYQVILLITRDPDWIRTNGPQLRRLLLYPAELRGQILVLPNNLECEFTIFF